MRNGVFLASWALSHLSVASVVYEVTNRVEEGDGKENFETSHLLLEEADTLAATATTKLACTASSSLPPQTPGSHEGDSSRAQGHWSQTQSE